MRKVKLYITDGYGNIPRDSVAAFTEAGVRLGAHKLGQTLVTGHTKADAVAAAKAAKTGTIYAESQLRVLDPEGSPLAQALAAEGYLDNAGWVFASPLDSEGVARLTDLDEQGAPVWSYLGKVNRERGELDTMERANSLDQAISEVAALGTWDQLPPQLREAIELTVNAAKAEAARYRIQLQNDR